jgi:hypothetical protein
MLTIFFAIKGVGNKEFVLAGQTFDLAYCCQCLKMCQTSTRSSVTK